MEIPLKPLPVYFLALSETSAVTGILICFLGFYRIFMNDKFKGHQRYFLVNINVVILLNCFTYIPCWAARYSQFHIMYEHLSRVLVGLYSTYTFSSLGLTVDRLIAITWPVKYSSFPAAIYAKVSLFLSWLLGIMSVIFLSSFNSRLTTQRYFLMGSDLICLVFYPIAYWRIYMKWNTRVKLADEIGVLGRALQRVDSQSLKVAFQIALYSFLHALTDIIVTSISVTKHLHNNEESHLKDGLRLFWTIINTVQPLTYILSSATCYRNDRSSAHTWGGTTKSSKRSLLNL